MSIDGQFISAPIRYAFRKAGAETVYRKLVAPYFNQPGPQRAMRSIAALNTALLGTSVGFSYLWRDIPNDMVAHDASSFMQHMGMTGGLIPLTMGVVIARSMITQKLKLGWSNWAKETAVFDWLSPQNRNTFVTTGTKAEAEQRIPNDIATLVHSSEQLTVGFANNASNFAAFSAILLSISPTLFAGTLALGAATTWVTHKIGKKLVALNNENTAATNAYRNALHETELHASSIALWKGEDASRKMINERLAAVTEVNRKLINTNVMLDTVQTVQQNIGFPFAYGVLAASYFAPDSKMSYGELNQAIGTTFNLNATLSWYNFNQRTLVDWRASAERLENFLQSFTRDVEQVGNFPSYNPQGALALSAKNLAIRVPAADHDVVGEPKTLCNDISFDLKAGDKLIITGEKGCGKSTLFHILAGLNAHETGDVAYSGVSAETGDVIFVPQDPFVPAASLDKALTYPKTGGVFTHQQMEETLKKVGLGHVAQHLQNPQLLCTGMNLSGGEKQCLNFARLLLHKPSVIGLDEATSAVDPKARIELHKLLFSELPDSIIISIAHQDELKSLHTHHAQFEGGEFQWTAQAGQETGRTATAAPLFSTPPFPVNGYLLNRAPMLQASKL